MAAPPAGASRAHHLPNDPGQGPEGSKGSSFSDFGTPAGRTFNRWEPQMGLARIAGGSATGLTATLNP